MPYSEPTAPLVSLLEQAEPSTRHVGHRSDAPLAHRAAEANISGTPGNDKLTGTGRADVLQGFDGNDTLRGKGGHDELQGGIGDDRLTGGKGNDLLHGGLGNDRYVVNQGDGSDIIQSWYDPSADTLNVLQYGAGVGPADVAVTRAGDHLLLSVAGTGDSVTVQDFFLYDDPHNANNEVQEVHFADGTVWDIDQLVAMALAGTRGDDSIRGTDADDTISGQGGDDDIDGGGGNDALSGDAGHDSLRGGDGDDILNGDEGDDWLDGGHGDDVTNGGAGNDTLLGLDGSNTLNGGAGHDSLSGRYGNDTYLIGQGDGIDTIASWYDPSAGKRNALQYSAGVDPADVIATRSGNNLVLSIASTADSVTVQDFFLYDNPGNSSNEVQEVHFADGTVWHVDAIVVQAMAGTAGADVLTGTVGNDTITGQGGDDVMEGRNGSDTLSGGTGNDTLHGGYGDDTLGGGADRDLLDGGLGNDTYLISQGDGSDTIQSWYDPSAGKLNVLQYDAGVGPADVTVSRSGDHLVLSIGGTGDSVTVENFFLYDDPNNRANELQEVHFTDGTVWSIDQLVAMALAGTPGMDDVIGTAAGDTISGHGGDDTIDGRAGNDTLDGGAGNDRLDGGDGDDTVNGGAGDDWVNGGYGYGDDIVNGGAGNDTVICFYGNDTLIGGAGDDTLLGSHYDNAHDNILDGGTGNDVLSGRFGDDTYLIRRGDGRDTIESSSDVMSAGFNVLTYDASVAPADIVVTRSGDELVLAISGTGDSVTVQDFFLYDNPYDGNHEVQEVRFADGTVWDIADLVAMSGGEHAGSDANAGATSLDADTRPCHAAPDHARYADQTDALVSAMAAFAPPAAGQTALLADYHMASGPIAIAMN